MKIVILPLFLSFIFIASFFSLNSVFAQTLDKPKFYCLGTDCSEVTNSTSPTPSSSSSTNPQSNEEKKSAVGGSIQFVDHKVSQVTGKDMSIKVKRPKNVQAGDIMIAMIGSDYAHAKKAPSGWNLIRQDVKNEGHKDDLAMQTYYKIATANEEGSYKWKMKTKRKDTPSKHQPLIAVDLYVFRGVDQNNPIVSSGAHGETEDPRAIECPSVKGVEGGMLICGYIGDDPGSITAPESMKQTSNFEIGGGDSYAIAYEKLNSGKDTGNRVATWNNSEKGKKGAVKNGSDFAHAIVLQPAK